MSNQPQAHVADERAAFEAVALASPYVDYSLALFAKCTEDFPRYYLDVKTQAAWLIWQAARAAIPAGANGTDANDICQLPPADWYCTRKAGHDGPCAAIQHGPDRELGADDHAAIACDMARIAAGAPAETPKPVVLDIEVLSGMLDRVAGLFSTAMDSAYCPSSDASKAARKAFHKSVETLRNTLEVAAQPAPASATDARDSLPPL